MNKLWLIFGLLGFTTSIFGQSYTSSEAIIRNDQFVVKWEKSVDYTEALRLLKAQSSTLGAKPIKEAVAQTRSEPSILDGIYLINVDPGTDILSICDSLLLTGLAAYAEPIYVEKMLLTPNDPAAQIDADQYYLSNIKAYQAWDVYSGNSSIVVGIIDSGADLIHEDLVANYSTNTGESNNGLDDDGNGYIDDFIGYDFADKDSDPTADRDPHGTRVAGLVGATTDNQIGMAGIGYNTSIVPLKIFKSGDNLSYGSYEAIQYAADNGYDVINLSWGSIGNYSQFSQDIISYAALEKDVLIVAAAGNTDEDLMFYPAAYDHVLSVAALDQNDAKASFATYSSTIDLCAPGVAMYATENNNGYGMDNGSSYAAPLVAGVGALIRGKYPELKALEVAERIKATTDPIYHLAGNQDYVGKLGTGRLNAFAALTSTNLTTLNVQISTLDQPNELLYYEDTVAIYINIENELDPVYSLQASLSSNSNFMIPIDTLVTVGYLDSGEKQVIGPFRFLIADRTPSSSLVPVYIRLSDDERHESYHALDFETAPDFHTLSNDSISLTVVADGNLGHTAEDASLGNGFTYNSSTTQNIGFFTLFNDSVLFDNISWIPSSGTIKKVFDAVDIIKPFTNVNAKTFTFTSFSDTSNTLLIESYAALWDSLPGKAVGLTYRISNLTTDTLSGFHAGVFADFDSHLEEKSRGIVMGDSLAFVSDTLGIHKGLQLIADSSYYSVFDMISQPDSLLDSDKKNLIISKQDSVGFPSYVDGAAHGTAYEDLLLPGASFSFNVLLASADSLIGLTDQLKMAKSRMNAFAQTPIIDTLVYFCDGGATYLSPEPGVNYYFFSDPLGADTLTFNDSLYVEQIESDSMIYYSRKDSASVSESIKAIEIQLIDEIASFKFIRDTVFLGDYIDNRVQITDLSFNPISWNWDFGNGTQAINIQNPAPVYADTGRYEVSLSVENLQGCTALFVKTLTVLERPAVPSFSEFGYCPGSSIQISHSNPLRVYPFPNSQQYIFEGNDYSLGPIYHDTTLYISRVENGIESQKKLISITQNPTDLTLEISPNDDSLSGFWGSFKILEPYVSNVSWMLDSAQVSSTNPAFFQILNDSMHLQYNVMTDSACSISAEKQLVFESSTIPDITSFEVCLGEDVLIQPEKGILFGFYTDSLLTDPITKGTSLMIDSLVTDTTVYVVGLDNLLPSAAVMVDIEVINYQFEIITSRDTLYLNQGRSIDFAVSAQSQSVVWFIDSVQQAISTSATLFFTRPGNYQIIAEGLHAAGCSFRDTSSIMVIEEYIVPLSTKYSVDFLAPVPASHSLYFRGQPAVLSIQAFDLTGRKHLISFDQERIDLTPLPDGIFLLELTMSDGRVIQFKGIKKSDQ